MQVGSYRRHELAVQACLPSALVYKGQILGLRTTSSVSGHFCIMNALVANGLQSVEVVPIFVHCSENIGYKAQFS